jgi:hypothetical protein
MHQIDIFLFHYSLISNPHPKNITSIHKYSNKYLFTNTTITYSSTITFTYLCKLTQNINIIQVNKNNNNNNKLLL